MAQEFGRTHQAPSVEEILDGLYASAINARSHLLLPAAVSMPSLAIRCRRRYGVRQYSRSGRVVVPAGDKALPTAAAALNGKSAAPLASRRSDAT